MQLDVEPFSCDGPTHWTVIEPASQLPQQQPAAATAGASGAHGGGTAPPTSAGGSAADSWTVIEPTSQPPHRSTAAAAPAAATGAPGVHGGGTAPSTASCGSLVTNNFANGFDKAVGLLAIVRSFLQGLSAAVAVRPIARGLAIAAGLSAQAPATGPKRISKGATVQAPHSNALMEGAAASVATEAEAARGVAPHEEVHP